jgi:hypothetical protein
LRNIKERDAANRKAFQKGISLENIFVYNMDSEALDELPIRRAYGAHGLYWDIKNPHDAEHIEKKLSVQEKKAAEVIAILHERSGSDTAVLKSSQVETIQKFLFVMHYRSEACSKSYFHQYHPNCFGTRDQFAEFQRRHELEPHKELWLDGLHYYVNTTHSRIKRDTSIYARAYKAQFDSFFLCMWEAADGAEFVLGDNSFGQREGQIVNKLQEAPGLHRIFPISPRLVLVLRSKFLRPKIQSTLSPASLRSAFTDLDSVPPIPIHLELAPTNGLNEQCIPQLGPTDGFTFKITKLTITQTFEVNSILLQNIRNNGLLTFTSKEKTLRTLYRYLAEPSSDHTATRDKYRNLVSLLQADLAGALPATPSNVPETCSISSLLDAQLSADSDTSSDNEVSSSNSSDNEESIESDIESESFFARRNT